MAKKKSRLKREKYSGTPAHQKIAAERRSARQLANAALKYNSTVDEFQVRDLTD